MDLTRAQVNLLLSLTYVLKKEWGISIGYTCPFGSGVQEENSYVIIEERINKELPIEEEGEENWQPRLYDFRDLEHEFLGVMAKTEPKEFPQHQEEVEAFWKKLIAALESGELYLEPGINREYDFQGEKITVDCTRLADERFSFKIKDNVSIYGFTRTLEQLQEEVKINQHRDQHFWNDIPEEFKNSIAKDHFKDEIALKVAEELITNKRPSQ